MKKLQYHLNCRVVEISAFLIFPGGILYRSCLLRSDSFGFGWYHFILRPPPVLEGTWNRDNELRTQIPGMFTMNEILEDQKLQSCLKFSWVLRDHRNFLWSLAVIFFSQSSFKTKKFIKTRLWPKETWRIYWLLFCVTLTLLFALAGCYLNVPDLDLKLTCCFCCECFWLIIWFIYSIPFLCLNPAS